MSALTDQQIQALIVLEVGDVVTPSAPSGILTTNIALVWQSYADKALIWPRLQELYSKRRCLDIVLGVRREQVDRAADTIRENLSQIAAELVISERTADTHVANILNKLGFTARTQVAAWAARQGLLPRAVAD